MHGDIQHLITVYGYWLMMLGALIEGETFLIAGGIAAQKGLLHLPGLIALAVIGSMIHDTFFFLVGRFGGTHYLNKRPMFKVKAAWVLELFDKYDAWMVIGLRFAYGLRTIIPMVLGVSSISSRRFLFFDLVGGILWSMTFIVGGYYFGKSLDLFMDQFNDFGTTVAIVVIILLILAIGASILGWIKRRARKSHNKFMAKFEAEQHDRDK